MVLLKLNAINIIKTILNIFIRPMCIDNLTLVIGNLEKDYKNKANSKWLKIIKKITPVFFGGDCVNAI